MTLIEKMRLKAAAKADRMKELAALAEAEGRDLTAEEATEFDACEKDVGAIMARVASLEAVEKSTAAPAVTKASDPLADVTRSAPGNIVPAEAARHIDVSKLGIGGVELAGVCAWAAAKTKHDPRFTPVEHLDRAGLTKIADASRQTTEQVKAFQSTTAGQGANTIDTPLSRDFIEFLMNESAFLSGAPIQIPLDNGSLTIAGGNANMTGSYGAEGADIGYTQPTIRQIGLSAKHLRAVTAISNYNLEISPLPIASIIGDNLGMSLNVAMDAAGLRGDGTGSNPSGILSLTNAANKFSVAAGTSPTVAAIDLEAKKALAKIRATNIPKRRRRWMMSSRVFTYLQFMRDGLGGWAYPGLHLASPTWVDGYPVVMSEQVPSTLGAGTNESEIYLVDFGHVLMGIARSLRLTASAEAAYHDGSALVSAFSRDETVVRGIASHDFDLRHDKAAVVMQAVQWGA